MGKPVIVTNYGEPSRLFKSCCEFYENNPKSIAKAILKVKKDKKLQKKLSENALEESKKYDLRKLSKKLEVFFDSIMNPL